MEDLVMKRCNLWLLFVVSLTCLSSYCRACEPFSCGDGTRFGYPFGRRNSGCGDPLLQLHCDNNTSSSNMPLLAISGTQYYILDYYNSTPLTVEGIVMTIIDKSLMPKECYPSSSNSMHLWSGDQLHIIDGYMNITLWEECQDPSPYLNKTSVCNASFYYSTSSDMKWTGKCKSHVQIPVRKDLDQGPNLEPVIKEGFKIKWIPSSSCKHCMSDKGTCAYEANTTSNPFFCKRRGKSKNAVLRGVPAGIVFFLAVWVLVVLVNRASSSATEVEKFLQDFTNEMPTRYSYSQLKKITDNFAERLEEGGFGVVYKGRLSTGNLVAVKILEQSRQSESQLMNEMATIGRIHHVHLVRLMGYCFENFKSALLYEYMANGSLEKFVFVNEGKQQILSWQQLYSIALGAARGIAYLHQDCDRRIVHFDIKPHNILLDADFTAKVSDFGLAKLCGRLDDHISITATRGTPGYVAPELWSRNLGPITDKADVYSFGILLLEIVGGRKNIDVQVSRSSVEYYPEWVFKLLQKGELEEMGCENYVQVRMCKIALLCIQYNSMDRPTMSRVVQMLEENGDEVNNISFPLKHL